MKEGKGRKGKGREEKRRIKVNKHWSGGLKAQWGGGCLFFVSYSQDTKYDCPAPLLRFRISLDNMSEMSDLGTQYYLISTSSSNFTQTRLS